MLYSMGSKTVEHNLATEQYIQRREKVAVAVARFQSRLRSRVVETVDRDR